MRQLIRVAVSSAVRQMHAMLWSILLVLATGWLVACSQDDAGEDVTSDKTTIPSSSVSDGVAISFASATDDSDESVTRASTGLESVATSFKLYGYKNLSSETQTVFPGYTVWYTENSANSTTDNTDDWYYVSSSNSQTIKYWDFSATTYRFMAYAPADASNIKATQDTDAGTISFTVPADASTEANLAATPYISALWCDEPTGSTVEMSFMQPFCRVRFMLIDSNGDAFTEETAADIITATFSFAPSDDAEAVYNTGTVTATYPITDGTNVTYSCSGTTTATMTEPYEASGSLVFASEAEKWYTVLPNTGQGAYTFTLSHSGEEDRTATVPAEYMQWQAGYQYTYVFKVDLSDIVFDHALYVYTKWQAGYADTTTW